MTAIKYFIFIKFLYIQYIFEKKIKIRVWIEAKTSWIFFFLSNHINYLHFQNNWTTYLFFFLICVTWCLLYIYVILKGKNVWAPSIIRKKSKQTFSIIFIKSLIFYSWCVIILCSSSRKKRAWKNSRPLSFNWYNNTYNRQIFKLGRYHRVILIFVKFSNIPKMSFFSVVLSVLRILKYSSIVNDVFENRVKGDGFWLPRKCSSVFRSI